MSTTPTRLKDVPGAGTRDASGRTRSGGEYYFGRDGGAAAPAVALTPPTTPPLASMISTRRDALAHASFIAAQASGSAGARGEANRTDWWSRSFGNAEWRDGATYPKMPDDFTPSGLAGQSVSGNRRTTRRWYRGQDVAVRMPSVAAVKRFSRGNDGGTFDLPVQIQFDGDDMQGWVRVTQHGQQWSVTGLGMSKADDARVSEAVRALLEHRTPTVALDTVQGLRERYRERVRQEGTATEPVDGSSFISGAAFDHKSGTLTLSMGGRHYAYPATAETFEQVKASRSPGRVFNTLIKGKPRAEQLVACDNCYRVHSPKTAHRCPVKHDKAKAPAGVWDRLARAAASVRDGRPRR